MEDLYRRLDELPFDLQELYRLMWLKMNPLYRQQAAQIFQLCREYGMQQLRTLTLAFAENEDVSAALETPFLVMTLTEIQRHLFCPLMLALILQYRARLFMLISVSGCSLPNAVSHSLST